MHTVSFGNSGLDVKCSRLTAVGLSQCGWGTYPKDEGIVALVDALPHLLALDLRGCAEAATDAGKWRDTSTVPGCCCRVHVLVKVAAYMLRQL